MKYLKYTISLLLIGLCISFSVYFLLPSATKFTVVNESGEPLAVTAFWLNEHKSLGRISVGDQITFEVNKEASIRFDATFEDGSVLSSEDAYFTSGAGQIEARVNKRSISINYMFEEE